MTLNQTLNSESDDKLQSLKQELASVKQQLAEIQTHQATTDGVDLLAVTEIALLSLSKTTCLQRFTPYAGELLGLKPSDIGRPIHSLPLGCSGDGIPDLALIVMGNASPIENVVTCSDGRHFLRRIQPVLAEGGQIEGIVITLVNISQSVDTAENGRQATIAISAHTVDATQTTNNSKKEKAFEKWRKQIERLQRMVENLPAGAVYVERDRMTMNRAAEEITGYGRGELKTLDQWFDKLFGKHAVKIRRIFESHRDSGFSETTPPIMVMRKDGSQRFVEFAGYRFEDQEVWLMYDITKRHLYAEALRSSEERVQAIMDNASEAIVVIGGDGVITDYNIAAENLFGYSAGETIGKNVSLLMPLPYSELHDTYIRNYRKTGTSKIMGQRRELPGRRKDGSIIPLELTVAEIDHRNLFCGMIRDLSEHKALEKEIADICTLEQERIGQDIHDGLGQQLTGLSMMATSLKHDLEKKRLPQARQLGEMIGYLNRASEEARTLSHGLAPISIMPQGLSDALKKLAENVKTTTGMNCRFVSDHFVENMDVTLSMQLYRIAQEAVNNALKYASPTIIEIKLESANGYILTVSDDGRGFNVDEMMSKRFGLRVMRYRAGIINSKLDIQSSPGEGTTIQCRQGPVIQL